MCPTKANAELEYKQMLSQLYNHFIANLYKYAEEK